MTMPKNLSLYSIADCPYVFDDYQDHSSWWCAVWATTPADALRYAYALYQGVEVLHLVRYASAIELQESPLEDTPCVESRPEVLRHIGWRVGDEGYCWLCDCAAMGLPEYTVCPECDACRVCAAYEEPADRCHCAAQLYQERG